MIIPTAKELHGREVVWLDGPQGTLWSFSAAGTRRMFAAYEFHGEYDDLWFVEMDGERETCRYNARHIMGVCWVEGAAK